MIISWLESEIFKLNEFLFFSFSASCQKIQLMGLKRILTRSAAHVISKYTNEACLLLPYPDFMTHGSYTFHVILPRITSLLNPYRKC